MGIDARNSLNNIAIGMTALTTGVYNFRLMSSTLPDGTAVYLKDKLLGTETLLTVGTTYDFTIEADSVTQGEKRFELVFSSKNSSTLTTESNGLKAEVLGNPVRGNQLLINISGAATQEVNVSVKDITGRTLRNLTATNGIQYINIGQTASSMIFLQVSDGKTSVTKKVMKL
jgi:hypothetical protein